jgi:uncharacterized membrane protein (DUF4010 family)
MLGGIVLPLAAMVLLIMAIQAADKPQCAGSACGGLLGAGFASGFVSSTATVAPSARRARAARTLACWLAPQPVGGGHPRGPDDDRGSRRRPDWHCCR